MDLNYSPEELAFRDEVRAWLARQPAARSCARRSRATRTSPRTTCCAGTGSSPSKGWVAPAWPKEWGGTGWNVVQRYIFEEELRLRRRAAAHSVRRSRCARPVLLRFGTEAQKKRFLPRIYNGDDFWCQGYSEPGSGSDLASLQDESSAAGTITTSSTARRSGPRSRTTPTGSSAWCAPTRAPSKRQEGISFLLIDMKTPGITVRPLILMDGAHEVNEVFFDDVKVPVENLVHEEGKGWTVAKYLLGHERMNTGAHRRIEARARRSSRSSRRATDGATDPRFRDRLSRARDRADGARDHQPALPRPHAPHRPAAGRRRLDAEDQGHRDPAGAHRADAAGGRSGRRATPFTDGGAQALPVNIRKTTIYAGSNEIQRNIIAKMTLGAL